MHPSKENRSPKTLVQCHSLSHIETTHCTTNHIPFSKIKDSYSHMTQMWPLTSQNTTTTTTTMKMKHESATTTTTNTPPPPSKSVVDGTNSTCHCCCLVTKLMRKLKRRRSRRRTSRQGSFQCLYDPLSYSLNFDSTGCGSLLDEDYYKFYAFSSRFVANPRSTTSSCPVVQVAAGNSH